MVHQRNLRLGDCYASINKDMVISYHLVTVATKKLCMMFHEIYQIATTLMPLVHHTHCNALKGNGMNNDDAVNGLCSRQEILRNLEK